MSGLRWLLLMLVLMLSIVSVEAQIVIGGSVYGGARQADVKGSTYVNIGADHHDVLITAVYGGNDISGTVGASDEMPIEPVVNTTTKTYVNETFNAFVKISPEPKTTTGEGDAAVTTQDHHIFIGRLFGGGDGAYTYTSDGEGTYTVTEEDNPSKTIATKAVLPELDKTYLEIQGGTIGFVFGGGNKATVTENTTICIDNQSEVTKPEHLKQDGATLLTDDLIDKMGLNSSQTDTEGDFQFARVFGGNNFADMSIRPRWFLKKGKIRNLYSGGNEGRMTSKEGLLLEIEADVADADSTAADVLWIGNVFGGCRKSDVIPLYDNGTRVPTSAIALEDNTNNLPSGFAARTRVLAGWINNVYGGNDISGNVYGGNSVGIYTTIHGNVYGGGNGSYAYTDNSELEDDKVWGDYYYNPGSNSVEALNLHRPNAEQVSIRVHGESESKRTLIEGALYVGGNSATLKTISSDIGTPTVELKIGSYVTADRVFLGNNGENMIKTDLLEKDANGKIITPEGVLRTMRRTDLTTTNRFNSINLKDKDLFAEYMKGCAMAERPSVVFDNLDNSTATYEEYTSKFGSFFCGGNVGSMAADGLIPIQFEHQVIIYDKLVGGCNNANVDETDYNAAYEGGYIGKPEAGTGDKLKMELSGLKIQPMRWKKNSDGTRYVNQTTKQPELEFNIVSASTGNELAPITSGTNVTSTSTDLDRRFKGGNIYGGCYNSGHINGNVVINLNSSVVDRKDSDGKNNSIFDIIEEDEGEAKLYPTDKESEVYKILQRRSGVILNKQGMDPLGRALNVFGGGYGPESEIWGSTTINLIAGYTFQIFGGGEQGPIGKPTDDENPDYTYTYTKNGETRTRNYNYDPKYSCIINVRGGSPGTNRGDTDNTDNVVDDGNMAEAEFIYGGGFFGPIAGNTQINLGNGRVFNTFGGSCNADILGHTETFVGRNTSKANDAGFPWVRDHIYGANDLGGRILGEASFQDKVSADILSKVHNPKKKSVSDVVKASAYIDYTQGRVDYIFGGCYGSYDYTDPYYKDYTYTRTSNTTTDPVTGDEVTTYTYTNDGSNENNVGKSKSDAFTKPRLGNAFVNFKPNTNTRNQVKKIFGAGQGYKGESEKDLMQLSSYVLIDIPQTQKKFSGMEVFGAGSYGGLGMNLTKTEAKANLDHVSAVIDLVRGQIANVYGGSWNEGFTRRTVVNVPEGSTIDAGSIFGGAFGSDPLIPCDVYEAQLNYRSENASVRGNLYGGNNHADRTLYGQVNVWAPVWNKSEGKLATVYGAGYGEESWSQYTEVNLNDGAKVAEVYGGGENGQVLNLQTVNQWKVDDSVLDLTLGSDYVDYGLDFPISDSEPDPDAYLVKTNGLGTKTNTNVYINKGATVGLITFTPEGQKIITDGYAFGGGKGSGATVSGTTYIGLHGGVVGKDLYGGGYGGSVHDSRDVKSFVATTNAYIEGGTLRKVFGGGYEGHVGKHTGEKVNGEFVAVAGNVLGDIPGATNVVIGIRKDQDFPADYVYENAGKGDSLNYYKGVPAIQWNAYGAGEGGSVFGTSHVILNNGYIGYDYDGIKEGADKKKYEAYKPKLDNETRPGTEGVGQLENYGSLFGAGYDDKSSSDFTDIKIYGGVIRGSLYGGGEIATVGRGKTSNLTGLDRGVTNMYLPGGTHIEMYNGHVQRHVFGGGKGYNLYGYGGSNELYTDGYVFGKTEVYIYGGKVGSEEGLADGNGNVFGGGDVGFVYGVGFFDQYTKAERTSNAKGTTGSPNHWYYYGSYECKEDYGPYLKGAIISDSTFTALSADEKAHWTKGKYLTEDCKVVVSPRLQVRASGGTVINGHSYNKYDYVTTEDLNTLSKARGINTKWADLFTGDKLSDGTVNPDDPEERGVHIYNAVFAGGNVSWNTDKLYSNAKTIFGNSTATLYDVYHRDFITVGTEHIGGLYGGGNLSVVDGYRELNITNYGTDYYAMNTQITLDEYQRLTNRERAYFQLEYLCQETHSYNGNSYTEGLSRITESEYEAITDEDEKKKWKQYGFCSIYAGRLLNTVQRADLCGVFGSRLVLQGAEDRVSDGDKAKYTINRVGELSLNKQKSIVSTDTGDDAVHGNYFGIYNVVNYLGHLTSDVKFDDPYMKWNKTDRVAEAVTGETYYSWKKSHLKRTERNNGTCRNQVALASGVFLEVTTEFSTKTKKVYGDITGIVELDLINVKKDIEGGGYVYARNEHGSRTWHQEYTNVILSNYNKKNDAAGREEEARTYKRYTYTTTNLLDHETSGNFIHKTKRIVDDCYPNNGVYSDGYKASPAHYWYIKGEVYIYDREVSAYAGSATAYMKDVNLPLTITAASEGKLQLLNVQPNLYAYYSDEAQTTRMDENGVKVNNESETYHLNDVITWWDWNQLSSNEQKYFIKETFVNVDSCTIGNVHYPAGTYVLAAQPTSTSQFSGTILDKKGNAVTTEEGIRDLFRSSNNISHDNGYVLTFDMDSPKDWDDWYSLISGSSSYTVNTDGTVTTNRKRKDEYDDATDSGTYREGPTFTLKSGETANLYGQRTYKVGEILSKEIYSDYNNTVGSNTFADQAEVERAYVATESFGNVMAGNPISATAFSALTAEEKAKYEKAMVCTSTIQLGENEYILLNDLVAVKEREATDPDYEKELKEIAAKYRAYNNSKQNADQLTEADALEYVKDRLSDAYYCTKEGLYGGQYYQPQTNYSAIKSWCTISKDDRQKFDFNYDAFDVLSAPTYPGEGHTNVYKSPYSDVKPVEYTALYTGALPFTYYDTDGTAHTIPENATTEERSITREQFEKIKNEQREYTPILVPAGSDTYTAWISTATFVDAGTPIAEGEDVTSKYNSLSNAAKAKLTSVNIQKEATAKTVYYHYKGTSKETVSSLTNITNYQKDFVIQGKEPTGTITFYVARESKPQDVLSEKIITLVYQYTYYESDEDSEGTTLVNELHVLNIHLNLESGVPEIGPLATPPTVLPGSPVGLKIPTVNPGMYEPISNGWEMFTSSADADLQRNGQPFSNNGTRLYWYQNQKVWVAFYTVTQLGKTYSNYVPISVANYHDLSEVMADKEHHMYVDEPGASSLRAPKIYLNQDWHEGENQLDLLKDFYDMSTGKTVEGATLNTSQVGDCKNLEFILHSNLDHSEATWTSIGDEGHCFEGTLHGEGYTIKGLDQSLFNRLCGDVYNLGVTGSFTGAGVAETGGGYVENCWVSTSSTVAKTSKPVFHDPTGEDPKRPYRIVNCYYQEEDNAENKYQNDERTFGAPARATRQDFYNGTVAFNLNSSYLNKRYYDKQYVDANTKPAYNYYYLTIDKTKTDNSLSQNPVVGYYPDLNANGVSPCAQYGYVGYVEDRYTNEDFLYADGRIPETIDSRQRTVTDAQGNPQVIYAPIWPDDYLFFGQMLTYGHGSRTHEDYPSHLVKSEGRLPLTDISNRVYRAPAYFQSADLGVAHFNPQAYLAAYSAPESLIDTQLKPVYPNMTAIDFAGHEEGTAKTAFKQGYNGKLFYQPLLDDDGLVGVSNNGETKNLLVYAPTDNEKTNTVLSNYFNEPAFENYDERNSELYNDGKTYNRVAIYTDDEVVGHLVSGSLTTTSDHLLVDKQDFFCPIGYTMGEDYRMWYQRRPDRFVDIEWNDDKRTTKGWDGISIPFEAALVSTQEKGEITHFYQSGDNMKGHEYWLRYFTDASDPVNGVVTGTFDALSEQSGHTKEDGNTFLWDYYYSKNLQLDANADKYQKYYSSMRTYNNYPLEQPATPYLIGFPGLRYYEFDLSRTFEPEHEAEPEIGKLEATQVITFASKTGITISASNVELAREKTNATKNGYAFVPNYLSKPVANAYVLNTGGTSYDMAATADPVPFRPYFVATTEGDGARTRSIIFSNDNSQLQAKEGDRNMSGGTLEAYAKRKKIVVESSLGYTVDVRIVNVAGITLNAFTIEPGETVEPRVNVSGVYIVETTDSRYTKKLAVK